MTEGPEPLLTIPDEEVKVPPQVIKQVRIMMRERLFGPTLQPTFRQRLLYWPSFKALMHKELT